MEQYSSRRVRCRLVWLVRFMSMLCTPEQLNRYANRRQLATIPAHLDRWPEATEHVQAFIKAPDGLQAAMWSDIVTFCAEAVQHGHAHEAAKLIDANNLTERWRPLREALVALAVGDAKYLDRVAPEIRQPALMLMEQLQRASLVQDENPNHVPSSA